MLSTNFLPLKNGQGDESYVVPHDKFKRVFNIIMNDYFATSYTIHEDAFYLLHNIYEKFMTELCIKIIRNSSYHNYYIQIFHVQWAFQSLYIGNRGVFTIVPLSSNPLARLKNESDFKETINIVLQQVHSSSVKKLSEDALSQLNRLGNAIAKELVDISVYMKNNFDNMDGIRGILAATRNLFPGELAKHAISEGEKAVKLNGQHLNGKFDEKIDNINLLDKESILFLRAVVEYIMAEIIELSGNVTSDNKINTIETKHINYAVFYDEELSVLLSQKLNVYFVCPSFIQKDD